MLIDCTACGSAALTKVCISPESIKTVLQCTYSIFRVIPTVVASSNVFCQKQTHLTNAKTKKTHVFLPN